MYTMMVADSLRCTLTGLLAVSSVQKAGWLGGIRRSLQLRGPGRSTAGLHALHQKGQVRLMDLDLTAMMFIC